LLGCNAPASCSRGQMHYAPLPSDPVNTA
jgi:hypothetical protein